MKSVTRRLAHVEAFPFLLPVFFVLHGYLENVEAMTILDSAALTGEYLLVSLIIFGNAFLIFRSRRRAALLTAAIMGFHFFFGAVHDSLKSLVGISFLSGYAFLLTASLLGFIGLIVFLRRSRRNFLRLGYFLNLLLLLFIGIELVRLPFVAAKKQTAATLAGVQACESCIRPDIYLIIADEYADSTSLQQIFGYNNGSFQKGLRERGFYIVDSSRSNYNFTPFAVASLLQMDYLTGIVGRNQNLSDKNRCYQLINKSPLWTALRQQGYQIRNHSIFNLDNIPTEAPQNYILVGADMVVAQTFLSRLNKDLRYHLSVTFKFQSEVERMMYFIDRCNKRLLTDLLEETKLEANQPRFVYTHLLMPHYPYFYNRVGIRNPLSTLEEGQQVRQQAYVDYLQYSNRILTETIDRILASAKQPPIILLMGDHGFREFENGFEQHAPYYFMNLNAVLLPNRNYRPFYEGISSVNQFRVLLNTAFNQRIPLLRDSSSLLQE